MCLGKERDVNLPILFYSIKKKKKTDGETWRKTNGAHVLYLYLRA